MSSESLAENLKHMKEIIREAYVFTNQLNNIKKIEVKGSSIDKKEKKLLEDSIESLINQLKILNNSIPELIETIGFYKKLSPETSEKEKSKLINVKYQPGESKEKVSLTITDAEREKFVENLSKSNLSIGQLKKNYAVEKPNEEAYFGKPNAYAKISNRFFREYSNKFIAKGYFDKLNDGLRKISSPFVLGTYVSMIFFAVFAGFLAGIFLFAMLLFTMFLGDSILLRIIKLIWIIPAVPALAGFLMYTYPASEGKSLGNKIDQELPFVVIHMSAIATAGVETLNIFKIILKNEEYKYTNREFKKLVNLINFQGEDFVTALKKMAKSSPSVKLRELLDGLATAISTGGELHQYLSNRAEGLLFDYKLEREKYTKVSETFMDIYISVVIAAPMILIMLFVIMGSTGTLSSFLGLSTQMLSFLIIFAIVLLNIGFLVFLKIKQPAF